MGAEDTAPNSSREASGVKPSSSGGSLAIAPRSECGATIAWEECAGGPKLGPQLDRAMSDLREQGAQTRNNAGFTEHAQDYTLEPSISLTSEDPGHQQRQQTFQQSRKQLRRPQGSLSGQKVMSALVMNLVWPSPH